MKTKMFKRVSVSALVLVLLLATLFAGSGIGDLTSSAASHIRELNGGINTNIEKYFDNSTIQKLPNTISGDDQISVILSIDRPTVIDEYNKTDKNISIGEFSVTDAAKSIHARLNGERNDILAAISEKGIDYKTGAVYTTVLNGFEIIIKASDFEAVARMLGDDVTPIVGEAYNVSETQLVENKVSFDEKTGIFDSSDFGYDGSGMLVAVLDTGLDYTHSAFSIKNFNPSKLAITKDEIAKLVGETRAAEIVAGLGADDVYVNDKVPFSFDYADSDSDVYSLHNNHGTHVSGVIVGKDDTITGVAPNAQLVSMKIFSDTRETAYTSWILSALEDCVVLGVDVINMSLGTSCGFSRESDKELVSGVYDDIRAQGISLVVAASNSFTSSYGSDKNGNLGLTSNPDTATVGSPSTYEGALSVASINGVKTPYILYNNQIMYFDECTDAATEEKDFVGEILPEGVDSKDFEFILVPGKGSEADYSGMDVAGKIALVERGFNTFEEKANAAYNAGAAGIIIYNNVSGDIRMNIGVTAIPACSISQDDGKVLAEKKSGTIKVSRSQKSGPFISDFSSWGPTPSLGIKPEITAHGGNILSAVTGGGYDRLSGTSMACPNMAGVIALLRQHVADKYGISDPVQINSMVNRLLMSTSDIIKNKNGLPYAVRKQGAGLANLTEASTTPAYILTYDRLTGKLMNTSKIELGDDPNKSGVYVLEFDVQNFSENTLSYKISADVMTEGVSDTPTHKGDTAVTEEGYMLEGVTVSFEVVSGGNKDGDKVVVGARATAKVKVTLTLSDANKKYMDESFENGMYVEGFVKLEAVSGTDVDLNAPYLAFYGDWTKAPLFDIDYFETSADELDDSIETLDKTLPDGYATRPVGGVTQDYVSFLGSYYFVQDPASTKIISANREYIAISNTDGTVHSLRFVWAGLLRNAAKIEITITDDATGEVIYSVVDEAVRKSYGDGGTIRPSNVEIEFDASEHNLKNNTEYTVRLVGYLDYGNGGLETNENNVFEFPLVTDFEAPAITDCTFEVKYDKSSKKNRLFAKLAIYDNHYTMAMMVGYVENGDSGYNLRSFDTYLTPVYSVRDGVTYVEYELTDHVQDIKNNSVHKNTFTVACYDYALNEATYEISLPDGFIDFYFENTNITLSENQLYTLKPLMYPDTEWGELLFYRSSNENIVRVVNDKIVAVKKGEAIVYAYETDENGIPIRSTQKEISVNVLGKGDEGYKKYDKPVADIFEIIGYDTLKAYYVMDTDDRDIGETGDYRVLDTNSLAMYPSESVRLHYKLDAYFPNDTRVVFESNNKSIVDINQNGVIEAKAKGYSSVTIKVIMDGKSTYFSKTINIEVKDPYVTTAPQLVHYYGAGGVVEIPKNLLITKIGDFAFSNYEYVPKSEDEINEDEPDTTKQWFIGDNTITKVIIPEGVKTIGAYAFANLTALKEVVLPSTIEAIEYGAFLGCTSLEKVSGIENVQLINKEAFRGCNIKGVLNLGNARAVGDYAFAGNRNIKEIVLPATLQSIGAYTFSQNTGLEKVTVNAEKVKYGPYVFSDCSSLTEMYMNANVIPTGAFFGASKLSKITIGKDVLSIGEFAFGETAVEVFTIESGNSAFKVQDNKSYVLSADGKTLVLVAPKIDKNFRIDDANITTVGRGAFSSNESIESIILNSVTIVEDYAFAYCPYLSEVKLGQLTKIGDYAFFRTNISKLPSFSSLNKIGKYAFGYTNISSVTIPAGMEIGEGAFCECKKLESVVIGDNVVIGNSAFLIDRDSNFKVEYFKDVDGKIIYARVYKSPLNYIKIGKNVTIGEAAFMGAAEIVSIELGEGAVIGDRAFYNNCELKNIDLSKAVSIGKDAFSGDDLYTFFDLKGESLAYDKEGMYIFKQYASKLESVNLSSAESIGERAFLYCDKLTTVKLGDKITEIPSMAFYRCSSLENINLENIKTVKTNAFVESGLSKVSLPSAEMIEKYAFYNCEKLSDVSLNANGTDLEEGAFSYCAKLKEVKNLEFSKNIGAYAFAYTGIVEVDLTGAVSIGDHAFLKKELTDFKVTLGASIEKLGDNPFALCKLAPFSRVVMKEFNGKLYPEVQYTFDFKDENAKVHVIDGSLYCDVPNGMELITYAGTDGKNVIIPDGTVRITAYAFMGADVVRVQLPYTLASIGHKAFYECDKLSIVVFTSYEAPNLEEEFDPAYYESLDNLPATGRYDVQDFEGNIEPRDGIGIVPYYMWNILDGKYSNVYYGANFVDYVGKVDSYIVMVRPSNGLYYDSFIYGQYFETAYSGDVAADDITLQAIAAINKLVDITNAGGTIKLEHKGLVEAARAAYNRVATTQQQSLVYNLSALLSAETRIAALSGEGQEPEVPPTDNEKSGGNTALIVVIVIESIIILAAAAAGVTWYIICRKNENESSDGEVEEGNAEDFDKEVSDVAEDSSEESNGESGNDPKAE